MVRFVDRPQVRRTAAGRLCSCSWSLLCA